jgi:hypothetical protein
VGRPGTFEQFLSEDLGTAPVKGGVSSSGLAATVRSTYVAGHIDGYLAEAAISGPDRAAEDAYARSLGYQIGKWPLLPLTGTVVTHNHGVLEVYQEDLVFRTSAGAAAMASIYQRSAALIPGTTLGPWTVSAAEPSDAFSVETVPPKEKPVLENDVWMIARWGDLVVRIAVQGGDGVSTTEAFPIGKTAVMHLVDACSLPGGGQS